jgi:hypothetical protein
LTPRSTERREGKVESHPDDLQSDVEFDTDEDADLDSDPYEDTDDEDDPVPAQRIVLVFTGANDGRLADVVAEVVHDAEQRGLFGEHVFFGDMEDRHIVKGSPLDQAVTGTEPVI